MPRGRSGRDLTGLTFGRLTVIERAPYRLNDATWICRCSCGGTTDATSYQLTHRKKSSCGCIRRELCREMKRCAPPENEQA